MDVSEWKGALHIILTAAAASFLAFAIGAYFPSIVPVRATTVKL